MLAAIDTGRRVPDDVRIVGFDDLSQSQYLSSPLTTIRQPTNDIGATAARVMFDRIQNPHRTGLNVLVQFDLIIRKSCGSPHRL